MSGRVSSGLERLRGSVMVFATFVTGNLTCWLRSSPWSPA